MRLSRFSVAGGICALALLPTASARGLSLEEALARAAHSRFEIAAIPREIRAGEGRITQAAIKPALELDLEAQNVFEESKVEMIFPHERGGKRDARVASARAGLELVGAQADVRRLEIGHQVRKAYFAVLAAEQSFELTEESLSLARSFADTVAEKVRAGAVSPIEETRAAVRLHGASAEIERARREVALARADLALAVGDPGVRSEALEGRLPEDTTIPDLAALDRTDRRFAGPEAPRAGGAGAPQHSRGRAAPKTRGTSPGGPPRTTAVSIKRPGSPSGSRSPCSHPGETAAPSPLRQPTWNGRNWNARRRSDDSPPNWSEPPPGCTPPRVKPQSSEATCSPAPSRLSPPCRRAIVSGSSRTSTSSTPRRSCSLRVSSTPAPWPPSPRRGSTSTDCSARPVLPSTTTVR